VGPEQISGQLRGLGESTGPIAEHEDGDSRCSSHCLAEHSQVRSVVESSIDNGQSATASPVEVSAQEARSTDAPNQVSDERLRSASIPKATLFQKLTLWFGKLPRNKFGTRKVVSHDGLVDHLKGFTVNRARDHLLRIQATREAQRYCKLHSITSEVIPGSVAIAMIPSDMEMDSLRLAKASLNLQRTIWTNKNLK